VLRASGSGGGGAAGGGRWDLRRQHAFELGMLAFEVLTGRKPEAGYGEDVLVVGGGVDVGTREACRIRGAEEEDFGVVARAVRELLEDEGERRLSLEEARAVFWWAWERAGNGERGRDVEGGEGARRKRAREEEVERMKAMVAEMEREVVEAREAAEREWWGREGRGRRKAGVEDSEEEEGEDKAAAMKT
jgi:hypothetical protein